MSDIYPNSFDFNLARENDFVTDKKLNKDYFLIQNIYKRMFEKYIKETLNLQEYDDLIKSSELNFGKCPKERMDFYQKNSTLNLDYIYIKNNLHIEKLNSVDIMMLKNNPNDELIVKDIVKRTYKDIIKIDKINGKDYKVNFKTQYFEGYTTNLTVFGNESIVIIIREGPANNGLKGIDFQKNLKIKKDFINELIDKMKNDFKNKLSCNIEIGHLLR